MSGKRMKINVDFIHEMGRMTRMNKYALLMLFPAGNFQSGNTVMDEISALRKEDAIEHFQRHWPKLKLDSTGYAKHGIISYCIAEHLS
jgi:hypothetical protein